MTNVNDTNVRTRPHIADSNYSVYEDGRIYSHYSNKFLKTKDNSTVLLLGRLGTVARSVWQSFNGPINSDVVVSFKDGNYRNCSLDNLYLRTHSEVICGAHQAKPDSFIRIKLTDEIMQKLVEELKTNKNMHLVAFNMGWSISYLYNFLCGKGNKEFYDKYGPFDYYKPIHGNRDKKYITNGFKSTRHAKPNEPAKSNEPKTDTVVKVIDVRHGSRSAYVINRLINELGEFVDASLTIKQIKILFNLDTYAAVKLKHSLSHAGTAA